MSSPKVLVTGATGRCGGAALLELVRRGVPARAMARDPRALAGLAGVAPVAGDFAEPASLDRALAGVERVLLVPPHAPSMEAWQHEFIAAARRAGVRHVVHVSWICADPDEPSISLGGHGRGELELEASGLEWTHLRPNSFFHNTLYDAPTIVAEGRIYGCVGDIRFAKIDARDVGAVAAVCLTEPGHEGQCHELSGPEALTHAALARALSEVLGRRVEYVDMPGNEYIDFLRGAGLPDWLADEFYLIYGQGPLYAGGAGQVGDVVERLTGRAARTFEQWVRDNVASFMPG